MTLQMTTPPSNRTPWDDAAPRAFCPQRGGDEELGGRVVSAHRTSEGVVRYFRCPCGALVTWLPGRTPRHATKLVPVERERPPMLRR